MVCQPSSRSTSRRLTWRDASVSSWIARAWRQHSWLRWHAKGGRWSPSCAPINIRAWSRSARWGHLFRCSVDRHGQVIRDVALARIALSLPDHPGQELEVRVALIRDWRAWFPKHRPQRRKTSPCRWDERPDGTHENWLDEHWQATPLPCPPREPKLIPIVTTAREAEAVELVQTYTRRWPAQENVIRDWLLPLGLDVNHGYAKTVVANSEVAKKREALQKRLEHVQRWAAGARKRMHNASLLHRKRCQQTKEHADALYRVLNVQQRELERQGVEPWLLRKTLKAEQAVVDADIEAYRQRQWNAYGTSNREFAKCQKYCREQRELLRALEDLAQHERDMYELDNRKDQLMTVCKVALANLGMWVRQQYFPASYAHAGWQRLQVFFQVPGRITWGREQVVVELRQFNDRALNRDLETLCAKVAEVRPCLPDGRSLVFVVQGMALLPLDAREPSVA